LSQTFKSIAAVVVGFIAIVVLSIGTDQIMRDAGIFPRIGQPMSDRLFVFAAGYRILISIFGCYLAARLAPAQPMKHALWLGIVGIVVSTIGAIATWNRGPEFGPHWYPVLLIVVALPCAWLGGKLREKQLTQAS
jgi:peptidoglycan/LPS O-acetylase OafA/YrhL